MVQESIEELGSGMGADGIDRTSHLAGYRVDKSSIPNEFFIVVDESGQKKLRMGSKAFVVFGDERLAQSFIAKFVPKGKPHKIAKKAFEEMALAAHCNAVFNPERETTTVKFFD